MTSYERVPHATLRQGDIILAPSAALLPPEPRDLNAPRVPPAWLGESQRLALWRGGPESPLPDVSGKVRLSPVLVLSHDCDLEKEFNERVRELLAGGVTVEEATAVAEADPSLDPFAVVAPLRPYTEAAEQRRAGIRNGQRIGCFPIDRLPGDGDDYYVDLGRPSTVSVLLLPQAAKVASLGRDSVFELRYKISEAYSIRDLAVLQELERLSGRTITRVVAEPKSGKKTALELYLDDGDVVHLEIRKPRDSLPEEIVRGQPR